MDKGMAVDRQYKQEKSVVLCMRVGSTLVKVITRATILNLEKSFSSVFSLF